jgi:hypothetical protein
VANGTKKVKPIHRNVRIPQRLDEMIVDIQQLLNSDSYTEALLWVLLDWEKFRYLSEKQRLLKLQDIRFNVLQHELGLRKE